MCEVDDSQVVCLVTVSAAVDAPVLAALIVGLASSPEDRFSFIDHVRAREGPVVRRDREVPGRIGGRFNQSMQHRGLGGTVAAR